MENENSQPTLLIVDDVPTNIQLLSAILKKDYQIKIATNGAKALEIVHSGPLPDLILLDIMMLEMDGFEATKAIRKLDKDNSLKSEVTIVAMTANAMVGDREKCLEAGMNDYISKPIAPPGSG